MLVLAACGEESKDSGEKLDLKNTVLQF